MPSSESLWIDEGVDASYAMQGSFADWYSLFTQDTKSTAQMPLPIFLIWVWEKVFGFSEYALRSINILWTGLTVVFLYFIGNRTGLKWLPLAAAAHPFLWFYTNEARPYAMQMMAASLCLWIFLILVEQPCRKIMLAFVAATFLLAVTSIINYVLAAVMWSAILFFPKPREFVLSRKFIPVFVAGLAVHLPLVIYYIATLLAGTGGVKALIVETGFASVALAFYELSGFYGLGPGRDTIRDTIIAGGLGALSAVFAKYILPLAAAGIFLVVALLPLLRNPMLLKSNPRLLAVFGCVVSFIAIILVSAILKNTALWGRHVSAALPLMLFVIWQLIAISYGLAKGIAGKRIVTGGAAGFLLLMLIGSLNVRFGREFRKDDYRRAAEIAITAAESGKTVWWAAGIEVTEYYAGMDDPLDERFVLMKDFKGEKFATAPEPDMIVLGRSTIYDVRGNIQEKAEALYGEQPDTSARNLRIWKDKP